MLDKIIRFALQNRLLMLAFAAGLLIAGTYTAQQLPVDVLPDSERGAGGFGSTGGFTADTTPGRTS